MGAVMAWLYHPVEPGHWLSYAMLNELRAACTERGISVTSTPAAGSSISTLRSWLYAMQLAISQSVAGAAVYWYQVSRTSDSDFTVRKITTASPAIPAWVNMFEAAGYETSDTWSHAWTAGQWKDTHKNLRQIYDVLNVLRCCQGNCVAWSRVQREKLFRDEGAGATLGSVVAYLSAQDWGKGIIHRDPPNSPEYYLWWNRGSEAATGGGATETTTAGTNYYAAGDVLCPEAYINHGYGAFKFAAGGLPFYGLSFSNVFFDVSSTRTLEGSMPARSLDIEVRSGSALPPTSRSAFQTFGSPLGTVPVNSRRLMVGPAGHVTCALLGADVAPVNADGREYVSTYTTCYANLVLDKVA